MHSLLKNEADRFAVESLPQFDSRQSGLSSQANLPQNVKICLRQSS